MGVSASGTTNHKTYLKKISWGFSPLSSLDPPMQEWVAKLVCENVTPVSSEISDLRNF